MFYIDIVKKIYTYIQSNYFIMSLFYVISFFKHLYKYSYVIIWLDSYASKTNLYYRCIKINLFQRLVKKKLHRPCPSEYRLWIEPIVKSTRDDMCNNDIDSRIWILSNSYNHAIEDRILDWDWIVYV